MLKTVSEGELYQRRWFRSWIATGGLAALLSAAPIGASGPGLDAEPVTLEIANATSDSALRCQFILAHFVTQEAATIGAGRMATVELRRMTTGGTLVFQRTSGEVMAVENVICGLDQDWAATRNDLVLARLRDGSRNRLHVVCGTSNGLSCAATQTDQ